MYTCFSFRILIISMYFVLFLFLFPLFPRRKDPEKQDRVSASSRAHTLRLERPCPPDGTPERTTPSAVLVSRRGAAVCVRLPCGGRRDCEGRTSRRTQISSHVGRDVPSSRSRAAHRHAPRSSVAAADGGIFVPDFNRRCKNCESFGLYTVSCSIKLHNIEYL